MLFPGISSDFHRRRHQISNCRNFPSEKMRTRAEKFCSGTNFLLCRLFLVINSRKKGREGTFGHVRYDMKKFAVLAVAVSALAISSQANAVHIRKQPAPSITNNA